MRDEILTFLGGQATPAAWVDEALRQQELLLLDHRILEYKAAQTAMTLMGRHLMRRLVRWAKGRRLERLYGDVLEYNQPMISLAESLGFHREALPDQPSLVRMVLSLRPPQPH